MNKKTITLDPDKLMVISNAFYWDEEKQKHFLNDEKLPQFKEQFKELGDMTYELELGSFDLNYEVMNDACHNVADQDHRDLADPDWDFRDQNNEFASVYTSDRLGYLNNNNQDEISQEMKEYDCDIQTACAIWYDRQVEHATEQLIDWVRNK